MDCWEGGRTPAVSFVARLSGPGSISQTEITRAYLSASSDGSCDAWETCPRTPFGRGGCGVRVRPRPQSCRFHHVYHNVYRSSSCAFQTSLARAFPSRQLSDSILGGSGETCSKIRFD